MKQYFNTITQGDSFELIKEIEDDSIDLILTDPPYFINHKDKDWDCAKRLLNQKTIELIESGSLNKTQLNLEERKAVEEYFVKLTKTLTQKLKKDGVLIVFNRIDNLKIIDQYLDSDKYTLQEWEQRPFSKQQSHINSRWYTTFLEWKKTNPNPVSLKNELDKSEYALIAFNMTESNPQKIAQIPEYWDNSLTSDNQYFSTSPRKNSRTIFYSNSEHVSPKPVNLWADLIKRFSSPNDIVFDPFSGSGITAFLAEDLKRNYIAFELEEEVFSLSLERLEKFKENVPNSAFIF